jgi:hypothetical protein
MTIIDVRDLKIKQQESNFYEFYSCFIILSGSQLKHSAHTLSKGERNYLTVVTEMFLLKQIPKCTVRSEIILREVITFSSQPYSVKVSLVFSCVYELSIFYLLEAISTLVVTMHSRGYAHF